MDLLGIIKEFCKRSGLPQPTTVIASQDDQFLQMVGFLNEVLEDLTTRKTDWTFLNKEATFTTIAASSQGTLESIAPNGFLWVTPKTFFDRTSGLEVNGPVTASEWQALQATATTGPTYNFRIWNKELYLTPTPSAGNSLYFEYGSDYSIVDRLGVTYRKFFEEDTDTCLFPDSILLAGLRYVWRRDTGLRFADQFSIYETLVSRFASHDSVPKDLNMNACDTEAGPAIFIPSGSWVVS